MKKEHLKKLEMPSKKAQAPSPEEMDMELGMEDEEMEGSEDEMNLDEISPLPEAGEGMEALAGISDDELVAEIKKRGLLADLESNDEEEMSEEEEDEYSI